MSVPTARLLQSTVDSHRYESAYVVVALPIPDAGDDDGVAPPLVYRTRRRHGRLDHDRHP
ncbi:hypothetical protein GCM10017581_010720 [Dactylosporangium matsuzakiense]|uniref:Uncharacterized protein n=1 Tax=Dactylosporangium matsuzakiense TaxID=53360 RepID=A0A9W6KEB8_9ACTN|nr:hypothetical protein GCM10017581_010720 [Dactylosporangium matsuzakiense]